MRGCINFYEGHLFINLYHTTGEWVSERPGSSTNGKGKHFKMCSPGQVHPSKANQRLPLVTTLNQVTANQEGKWLSKIRIHTTEYNCRKSYRKWSYSKSVCNFKCFSYKGKINDEKYMSCWLDIILNLLCSISQCKFRMPFAPSKYTQILLKVQVQLKHAVMNHAQSKQKKRGSLVEGRWWPSEREKKHSS